MKTLSLYLFLVWSFISPDYLDTVESSLDGGITWQRTNLQPKVNKLNNTYFVEILPIYRTEMFRIKREWAH